MTIAMFWPCDHKRRLRADWTVEPGRHITAITYIRDVKPFVPERIETIPEDRDLILTFVIGKPPGPPEAPTDLTCRR